MTQRASQRGHPSFHGMIANSAPMRHIFKQIQRVAPHEASVLIRGETGTGKELVARALHELSGRAQGPFCAINCATLTPERMAVSTAASFVSALLDRFMCKGSLD